MRTKPTRMLVLGVAFAVSGCGSDPTDASSSTESGGSVGSGGGSMTATGGSSSSATGGGAANPTGGSATGGVATGGTTVQPEDFELQGTWLYLGPWEGRGHTIQISNTSMVYTAVAGDWSSNWTIQKYDNGLYQFQFVFESGTGEYSPTGQNKSAAYVLNGPILTVQLADGLESYPPVESPGSCTEDGTGTTRIVDCGLYMKQ